ncbi:MAG: D-alanyl-D-alanine dipeptidase [Bacillota bacterium]
MNFRVFFRTLFLVALLAAVAFTVYANVAGPDKLSGIEPETAKLADDNGIESNGDEIETGSGDQPWNVAVDNGVDGVHNEESVSRSYVKENVKIVVSALGDVALGQDTRFNYTDSFGYVYEKIGGDPEYFFSGVVDILSGDDLTIANLETTLYNGKDNERAEKYDYGNNYWFKGKPEYANILKATSIEAVTLANNHTYDYGPVGYEATKKALDDAGIKHFGYSEALYMEIKGIKVGIAGFNQLGEYEQGLDMDVFKREVEEMTKKLRGECDLVIVNFHWGKEYKYQPEALQKELAYLAIDSGADLVIGHHPHVLQPIEVYRGKYIAYSLGNFCFGGNKNPPDFDTAIFSQTFTFDSDNVLQHISEPVIVPCLLSSRKDYNNYKPVVVTEPAQKKRIYEKLDFMDFLSEEEKAGIAGKTDMVRVDALDKNIVVDLKYATSDNITGKPVYESNTAYLRKGTAEKLKKANSMLMEHGFRIKIWDAYRRQKYQQILYESAENKYYFMDPKKGSNHTRGAAVDVTLVDKDGNEADMPSGFDEMSEKAHRTYAHATPEQKKNALLLEEIMKSCGFIPLQKEWWHFDDSEWRTYDLLPEYPPEK